MANKFSFIKLGNQIQRANISAMNRAARSAVTAASSFIRRKYNIKKRDLDVYLRIRTKASTSKPYVTVVVKKNDISLYYFKATQFGKPGRPKQGKKKPNNGGVKATVQIKERKLYRSKDDKRGSFIWTDGDLVRGVFIRTGEKKVMSKGRFEGKEREKIVKLYGANLLQLFDPKSGKSLIIEEMEKKFFEVYENRLEHELSRI